MSETLLTAQQAATHLGVKLADIYRWESRYDLPGFRTETGLKFKLSDLESFTPRYRGTVGLQGSLPHYVPETSEVFTILLKRKAKPFSERHTCAQECQQIALYLTDPEYSVKDLLENLRILAPAIPKLFAHWGASHRPRKLLDVPTK